MKFLEYLKTSFHKDLLSGLTVSMISIPQSMAYAAIGGLEPIVGLYAAMLPTIIGALFGSSHYLVTGATNAIALTTASILVIYIGTPEYTQYAFVLAIASGLIMLLIGLFNLSGLIRFISNSVLTAFLAGAGCLILINQAGGLMGIDRPVGSSPLNTIQNIFQNLENINIYILIVSAISILILLFFNKITKKIPAAFMVMLICGILVSVFGWHEKGVRIISDISNANGAMFRFAIPDVSLNELPGLIISAFVIAILALVQTISIAKPLAYSRNEILIPKKDFIGQGLASITSGFVGGMPTAGSLAQTAINYGAGAKTKFSAVFSGLFVFLATILFSEIIGAIPIACLSSIVIVSAIRMIDYPHLRQTWRNSYYSKIVLMVTFVSAIVIPIQYAIFIGTGLSIFLYLYESKNIKMSYLKISQNGNVIEFPLSDFYLNADKFAIINIEGSMYFGSVDSLEMKIKELLAEHELDSIVFYMRSIHSLASTMMVSFKLILQVIEERGIDVYICGVAKDMYETLLKGGIDEVIDLDHIYLGTEVIFEALKEVNQRIQ